MGHSQWYYECPKMGQAYCIVPSWATRWNHDPFFVIILKNTSNTFFILQKKTTALLQQGIWSDMKRNLKLHANDSK